MRAFRGVGGSPVFFKQGEGAWLIDEDDNRYVDYIGSWGPLILGHRHPSVISALKSQMEKGLTFGAPTAQEGTLAELITQLVPSIESVRLVNSGTEATMSAIRLARGFTRRDKILKVRRLLPRACGFTAGESRLRSTDTRSTGLAGRARLHLLLKPTYLPYNDLDSVTQLFEQQSGEEIACIIIEPVAGQYESCASQSTRLPAEACETFVRPIWQCADF